jgi:hypothetical protein
MSSFSNLELMQRIFSLFTDEEEFYCKTGVVKELNESNKTCRVELDNGDPDIQFVKYVVNASSAQGIEIKPKVGSQVTVGFLGTNNAAIIQIQEFDCITYDAGVDTILGADKLTTKINALVNEIKAMNVKINANTSLLKSHVHPVVGATPLPPAVAVTTTAPPTLTAMQDVTDPSDFDKGDYEYDKIKIP